MGAAAGNPSEAEAENTGFRFPEQGKTSVVLGEVESYFRRAEDGRRCLNEPPNHGHL